MWSEPRLVIERLCAERGEDFAGLSRMLGRNPAYIQQFVRRGVPKRLKEAERRKLARYFAISESMLGGPAESDDDGSGGLVAGKLSIIRVEGDSMAPTLNAGDDILVDPADCAERLRDGIYVLRVDDALVVKRIALHPVGRRVTVQSDNPAYPDWPDCEMGEIACIGRVIWAGRKID